MVNLVLIKMVDAQVTLPGLHHLLSEEAFPSFSHSWGFTVNIMASKSMSEAPHGSSGRFLACRQVRHTGEIHSWNQKPPLCRARQKHKQSWALPRTADRQRQHNGHGLVLILPVPWKAMLGVHGTAALLRQGKLSVLPISTQASWATNSAQFSTPSCPYPKTRLQILRCQLSLAC